jgi:hypothetical protein
MLLLFGTVVFLGLPTAAAAASVALRAILTLLDRTKDANEKVEASGLSFAFGYAAFVLGYVAGLGIFLAHLPPSYP